MKDFVDTIQNHPQQWQIIGLILTIQNMVKTKGTIEIKSLENEIQRHMSQFISRTKDNICLNMESEDALEPRVLSVAGRPPTS